MKRARSITEARRQFEAAERQLHTDWEADWEAWKASLPAHVPAALLDDHEPMHDDADTTCSRCAEDGWVHCGDGCCGPPPMQAWPCAAVRDGLPDGTVAPPAPQYPTWRLFWDDPEVEAKFAHFTTVKGFADVRPGDARTVRHSVAITMRGALDVATRERIDAMR